MPNKTKTIEYVKVICPHCKGKFRIKLKEVLGKSSLCPLCSTMIDYPAKEKITVRKRHIE